MYFDCLFPYLNIWICPLSPFTYLTKLGSLTGIMKVSEFIKRSDAVFQKSRIRETPIFSTNADSRTNKNLKRLVDFFSSSRGGVKKKFPAPFFIQLKECMKVKVKVRVRMMVKVKVRMKDDDNSICWNLYFSNVIICILHLCIL